MSEQRVLVTGADGFVGRHLVGHLSSRGWEVAALCLPGRGVQAHRVFHADLLDSSTMHEVPREFDAVVHLAAVSVPSEVSAGRLLENVQMAVSLLEHLRRGRVLLVSSSLVYAPSEHRLSEDDPIQPAGPYGLSKMLLEAIVPYYRRRLDICVVRPFNHIGSGMPPRLMVPSLLRRVKELSSGATTLVMRGCNSTRDFIDVRDIVRAYECLLQSPASGGGCFNVCTGMGHSVEDLATAVLQLAGRTCSVHFEQGDGSADEVMHCVGSPARLAESTGWRPLYRLDESLKEAWERL